jgi:shikimate kinase
MRNIVLMGFMGTGKTTVGKRLADRLGLTFVDMDKVIEQRARKPIPRIFAEDGEPAFRVMERNLAHELSRTADQVIACGGGVVLNPDNVTDYGATGLVVCLNATPDIIFKRTAKDRNRPLLEEQDRMRRILELLEKRRALYAAIPCQVDTSDRPIEAIVNDILAAYQP